MPLLFHLQAQACSLLFQPQQPWSSVSSVTTETTANPQRVRQQTSTKTQHQDIIHPHPQLISSTPKQEK